MSPASPRTTAEPDPSSRGPLSRIALPLAAVIALLSLSFPVQVIDTMAGLTQGIIQQVGVVFLWIASAMLLLALALGLSPVGRLRLGPEDEPPAFSRIAWLAMLFAAGMGSGLVFWGVAEPLSHAAANPLARSGTAAVDQAALALSFLHWGLHAWAIYAIAGLVVAWFAFRLQRPAAVSAPIVHLLERRLSATPLRHIADGADLLAILAVVFGVAGTLANGIILLTSGAEATTGAGGGGYVRFALLILLTLCFLASAMSGLHQGIRWLSLFNLGLALLLAITLAWAGPTLDMLQTGAAATLQYLTELLHWSSALIPVEGRPAWARDWTVIYLIWWIAWTPFVGVFIARISRGRRIREYLAGVILVPTIVSILWFSIFGGGALSFAHQQPGLLEAALAGDYTRPLFVWLGHLPLAELTRWAAIILLFVFLVTSADSAAYVLGMLARGGQPDPPAGQKVRWGLLTAVIAAALLIRNDVDINKAVAILGAIPFTLILLLQTIALLAALRRHDKAV